MEIVQSYKSSFRFNAIHNMSEDESKKHPHTFFLSVYMMIGSSDDFKDYATIERKIEDMTIYLQGKYINELEYFLDKPATIENIGQYFYYYIKSLITNKNIHFLELEIGDSPLNKVAIGDVAMVGSMNMYIPVEKINKYFKILEERNGKTE